MEYFASVLPGLRPDHYAVYWRRGPDPNAVVIAPHGGEIEPRTTRIAQAVAEWLGCSGYIFVSRVPTSPARLAAGKAHQHHINSRHFRPPTAMELLQGAQFVFAIHGTGSSKLWNKVAVGGLDVYVRGPVIASLREAGFDARVAPKTMAGVRRDNIVNLGLREGGVQVEVGTGLRAAYDTATQYELGKAIGKALVPVPHTCWQDFTDLDPFEDEYETVAAGRRTSGLGLFPDDRPWGWDCDLCDVCDPWSCPGVDL